MEEVFRNGRGRVDRQTMDPKCCNNIHEIHTWSSHKLGGINEAFEKDVAPELDHERQLGLGHVDGRKQQWGEVDKPGSQGTDAWGIEREACNGI